jgi:cyclopropane fatty-acyl-phospholipid synthase-like methyltransferase
MRHGSIMVELGCGIGSFLLVLAERIQTRKIRLSGELPRYMRPQEAEQIKLRQTKIQAKK